jgi:hypothetical protein
MSQTNCTSRSILLVVLLAVILLAVSACSHMDVTINPEDLQLSITLRQQDFDPWLENTEFSMYVDDLHLLDVITSLELHDGFIRYLGYIILPDRSIIRGSYDVSITAEDGGLKTRIIAMDIPGMKMDDTWIARQNYQLEREFRRMVAHADEDVYFESVQLDESMMTLKLHVHLAYTLPSSIRVQVP